MASESGLRTGLRWKPRPAIHGSGIPEFFEYRVLLLISESLGVLTAPSLKTLMKGAFHRSHGQWADRSGGPREVIWVVVPYVVVGVCAREIVASAPPRGRDAIRQPRVHQPGQRRPGRRQCARWSRTPSPYYGGHFSAFRGQPSPHSRLPRSALTHGSAARD